MACPHHNKEAPPIKKKRGGNLLAFTTIPVLAATLLHVVKLANDPSKISWLLCCSEGAPFPRSHNDVGGRRGFRVYISTCSLFPVEKADIYPILKLTILNNYLWVKKICMKFALSIIASLHLGDFLSVCGHQGCILTCSNLPSTHALLAFLLWTRITDFWPFALACPLHFVFLPRC